jgi:lipoate-protein ligase A
MPPLVNPTARTIWRKLTERQNSVFLNLAVEEALTRSMSTGLQTQPTIRLWVNPKAVVVGRFQEVGDEVDLAQCRLDGVQVARRFTGGGTVYHDERTLNFTIAGPHPESVSILRLHEINLQLVGDALRYVGLDCTISPPNSILIHGRKVCGAAAAVGMHFALWHCSILVDSDTRLLERTLAPGRSSTASRFVRSVRRPVTTLAEALSRPTSIGEVADSLERSLQTNFGVELESGQLSRNEEKISEALFTQKYSSDEWNMKGKAGLQASEEKGRANHTTIAV